MFRGNGLIVRSVISTRIQTYIGPTHSSSFVAFFANIHHIVSAYIESHQTKKGSERRHTEIVTYTGIMKASRNLQTGIVQSSRHVAVGIIDP